MRFRPEPYRLSFILPDGARAPGSSCHCPSPEGCALTFHAAGLVVIVGPSREACFEHAARFLRVSCRGLPPAAVSMKLRSLVPPGVDSWTASVGTDVAFSPTALPPHLPMPEIRGPPLQLATVDGARVD